MSQFEKRDFEPARPNLLVEEMKRYRCPKCSQVFFVIGVLSRHIMDEHPE